MNVAPTNSAWMACDIADNFRRENLDQGFACAQAMLDQFAAPKVRKAVRIFEPVFCAPSKMRIFGCSTKSQAVNRLVHFDNFDEE